MRTGTSRAALAATALAIALSAPGALAQAKTTVTAREVFGKVKSVTPTQVVISHITTARAVKRTTLKFSIVGATLKNSAGKSSGFTYSDIKPGDLVDGLSSVSASATALDEVHGIPVPLGVLQDLTRPLAVATLNIVDLAAVCEETKLTIANVCGHFIWGGLSHISSNQLTIAAAGRKVKLNTTFATLFGGWPVPAPVTATHLRLGETIIAATSPLTSFNTILGDVSSGTPVPILVVYESG